MEDRLGSPLVSATSQTAGFSPGVAARLRAEDGGRVFVKAVGPEPNAGAPSVHHREARVSATLSAKAPVPRLL